MSDEQATDQPAPSTRLRTREVMGVPVLPPAGATRLTNRLRAGLARLGRAPAPPPVRILEGLLGALDLAALVALCRIGLPDRLTGPTDVDTLAADLHAEPERLLRLLRYSATRGWVRLDRRGRVRPTPTIAFLRTDHPGGWRAWVEFMAGHEILATLGHLHVAVHDEGDPFAAATGASFFEWMATHPPRHAVFDDAMAAGGRMHGLVLARALDWSSSRRVCDVGGGTGALLTTLLGAQPHLEGVLLDLPEVVDRAPTVARLTAVGGDAFASVPAGCDTYLLVNVLHDWGDTAATRMLSVVAAALAQGGGGNGRVVVVESGGRRTPRDDISVRADLLMFALTAGGRERTRDQFADLATAAGLRLTRSQQLASGATAHVMAPE